MSEPEMYPGTDSPNYSERFDTTQELIKAVDGSSEGLNHLASWFVADLDEVVEWGDDDEFGVLLFMPRKSQTVWFHTSNVDREVIDVWVCEVAMPRIRRWYGMEARNE